MKKIILFIFFTIFIYNSKINSLFAQSTCKNDIDFSWRFVGPENYRNAEFQIRNNSNKNIIISKLTLFTKDDIEMTSSNPNANLKPFGVIKLVLLTYDLNRALAMSGSVYCKYP